MRRRRDYNVNLNENEIYLIMKAIEKIKTFSNPGEFNTYNAIWQKFYDLYTGGENANGR